MKVDVSKLKFGVDRSKQWIDEHPKFLIMQDRLKKSILTEGLKNPLIINDDYVVQIGNQRLLAIIDLGLQEVECIFENEAIDLQKFSDDDWDPDKL
jgi:hypothetical protein